MVDVTAKPEGVVINVRVTPRATRNEICGEQAGAVRIRLQAPPVEGKANNALLRFLAAQLGIPRRRITVVAGEKGRNKRVLIAGLDAKAVVARLKT